MNNFLVFNVTSLILFLTLFITMLSRKNFHGITNHLFILGIIVSIIANVFRLAFTGIINYCVPGAGAAIAAKIFLYLFYITRSFIFPIVILYLYSKIGILQLYKNNLLLRLLVESLILFPILFIITNIFTDKIFVITDNLEVMISKLIGIEYICTIIILCIGIVTILKFRKFMQRKNVIMGGILFLVNMIFLFIYYIFPRCELEMFTIAITSYLIMNTVQRPELFINPLVKSGTATSFFDLSKRNFIMEKEVLYVFVKIKNYKNIALYIGQRNFEVFLNEIADFLNQTAAEYKLGTYSYYLDHCLFVIPCENNVNNKVDNFAKAVEQKLKETFSLDGFNFTIDARICVVNTPDDISSNDYLNYFLKKYHHTLPQTKNVIYLKDFKNSTEFKMKNDMENILEKALLEKNFEIFYHPIYGVYEEAFVAAEALLRLKDDYFGYISPTFFIPVAERNRQMSKIGDIVFEKVFTFVASEDFKKMNLEYIEINLSIAQCSEYGLAEKVREMLIKYNVDPKNIRFEITENAADFNPEVVENNISELKKLGINFALDDYGTGYSNIKKVLSLPVDIVKLDKTFVDEIDNDKLSIVISDTIEMLKTLKKRVLVEGIESKRALDHFTSLKYKNAYACEYIQGYYFTRPLPERDFVEFICKD